MWAGASVNFEYLVYGAVLMTFGFTFAQAVFLILVGNISYLLLGVCSLQGPDGRHHGLHHQSGRVRPQRLRA